MSQENEAQGADDTPIFAVKPGVPRETAPRQVSIYRMFDTPPAGFGVDQEEILAGFHDAPGFHIKGGQIVETLGPGKAKDKRDQPIGQAWQPDTQAQSPCCGSVMDIVGPKTYRCPSCSQIYREN